MRSAITTLTCALILLQSVYAIKPTEIEWQNATGHKPSDPAVEYSLLSFGSLRAEFSSDLGTVMAGWLKSHPGATVVPVITREPFNERIPNSKFIFVWLIDHEDNLNVYLVRHGCVAATQMLASFDDQFRSIRDELKLPKDKLHVPSKNMRRSGRVFLRQKDKRKTSGSEFGQIHRRPIEGTINSRASSHFK